MEIYITREVFNWHREPTKSIDSLHLSLVFCYAGQILWFVLCLMLALFSVIAMISNIQGKLGHWFYNIVEESLVVSGSLDRRRVTYELVF
jgi:hypothetical protein